MGNCSYCDSFILFGGKTDQSGVYCNAKCQQAGHLLALSGHLQPQELDRLVEEVYRSNCPRCNGPGPVDVHKAHEVWSALVLTSWSSRPAVSCKSCATKRQAGAMLFSGVLGWWGFPWGLVMTPVQIGRNITEMIGGPQPGVPSGLLKKFVRLQAGAQIARNSAARPVQRASPAGQTPPPLPASIQATGDERYMPKAKA
jgi:hypothetical protein